MPRSYCLFAAFAIALASEEMGSLLQSKKPRAEEISGLDGADGTKMVVQDVPWMVRSLIRDAPLDGPPVAYRTDPKDPSSVGTFSWLRPAIRPVTGPEGVSLQFAGGRNDNGAIFAIGEGGKMLKCTEHKEKCEEYLPCCVKSLAPMVDNDAWAIRADGCIVKEKFGRPQSTWEVVPVPCGMVSKIVGSGLMQKFVYGINAMGGVVRAGPVDYNHPGNGNLTWEPSLPCCVRDIYMRADDSSIYAIDSKGDVLEADPLDPGNTWKAFLPGPVTKIVSAGLNQPFFGLTAVGAVYKYTATQANSNGFSRGAEVFLSGGASDIAVSNDIQLFVVGEKGSIWKSKVKVLDPWR